MYAFVCVWCVKIFGGVFVTHRSMCGASNIHLPTSNEINLSWENPKKLLARYKTSVRRKFHTHKPTLTHLFKSPQSRKLLTTYSKQFSVEKWWTCARTNGLILLRAVGNKRLGTYSWSSLEHLDRRETKD